METVCHLERKGKPLCRCSLKAWKRWAGTNWYCQFNSLPEGKAALRRIQQKDPDVVLVMGKCPQVVAEELYKLRNNA
jgi:hypothetical protein